MNILNEKVGYTSDLHLNMSLDNCNEQTIRAFARHQGEHLNVNNFSYYIINGDISWIAEQVVWFLDELKHSFHGQVRRTLGNHCLSTHLTVQEYIHFSTDDYLPTNPIILSDKIIVGCSGFFDLSFIERYAKLLGNRKTAIERVMIDFNKRYFKEQLVAKDVEEILPSMFEQLKLEIMPLLEQHPEKETIMVTHYLPHETFLAKAVTPKTLSKDPFMGSNKMHQFNQDLGITTCYFGHTHRRLVPTVLDGIMYQCNPVGTVSDWDDPDGSSLAQQWESTLITIQ